MRTISQKDLRDLKAKNIRVIDKGGRQVEPKTNETEKSLAKVSLSSENILSQMAGMKTALIRVSEFMSTQNNLQNIQNLQNVQGKAEIKKKKRWEFSVVRNKEKYITKILAREI